MTGFWLKMLAAFCMLIDHTGAFLFPDALWLRCIGRISFPIFAYFIAEGYRYTRSFRAYFLRIFGCALLFQIGNLISGFPLMFSVFVTFSLSLLLMRLCDLLREAAGTQDTKKTGAFFLLLVLFLFGCFALCSSVYVEYGFVGIITPSVLALFAEKRKKLISLAACLLVLCIESYLAFGIPVQIFSFAALIPLSFYNEKPGRYRWKYFFYIFYPLHLIILAGIAALLGVFPAI